jgi:hypothetical protein
MEATFTYSLRKYLDEYLEGITRAVIIEDGVVLTDEIKPFVTIEYLGENSEIISTGRKSYEEIHRYSLGLFAESNHQRAVLREELRELLLDPTGIPIYEIGVGKTGERFLMDVSAFAAMSSQDEANETYQNHGYFTGAVEILRNVGESTFTQ